MDLFSALDGLVPLHRGSGAIVALVGAGGKTTAMFSLASEAKDRGLSVIVTSTTSIRDPRQEVGRSFDSFLTELPTEVLPAASITVLASSVREGGKVSWPAPDLVGSLRPYADLILVEADGSRGLPVKAPAVHEPVMPSSVDLVIGCIGLDAVGAPAASGRVHRLAEFLRIAFLSEGQDITPNAIARLVRHPEGLFKSSPRAARRVLLFTKAETLSPEDACSLEALSSSFHVDRLLWGRRDLAGRLSLDESGMAIPRTHPLVVVRGAGDLATGVIIRLWRSGYRIVALECSAPTAIRRTVAFSEAVYKGVATVEGLNARLVPDPRAALALLEKGGEIPVLVDPEASSLKELSPTALIDAIIAKQNLGTTGAMAPLVIGLGPGFVAGEDGIVYIDAVIETNRGHDLARIIWKGRAAIDTGIPGDLGGASEGRVLKAEVQGRIMPLEEIGAYVRSGQPIAFIATHNGDMMVYSKIDGILRGMIRPGFEVWAGLKIADVDPRGREENCATVSDKARALGGAVLEALLARGITP